MSLTKPLHRLLNRLYRYRVFRYLKDEVGVPLRHFFFGKKEFYKVLDIAAELEREAGKEIRTVFDVGAAIGDKAYVLAKTFPRATIYCFEPHPASFSALQKRMSPFGERAQCYNFGFYNTDGKIDFFLDGSPDEDPVSAGTSSFLPRGMMFRPDTPEDGGTIKASVRRLDDFVKEKGISRIDFMKVDVEASEKELIEGGKNALKNTDNLFIEIMPMRRGVHSRDYIDTIEAIHNLGFSLFGIYEDFFFTKLVKDRRSRGN